MRMETMKNFCSRPIAIVLKMMVHNHQLSSSKERRACTTTFLSYNEKQEKQKRAIEKQNAAASLLKKRGRGKRRHFEWGTTHEDDIIQLTIDWMWLWVS